MATEAHSEIRAASARAARFLRAPAETPGACDWASFLATHYLDLAIRAAIRAGDDKLALRISDVEAKAAQSFRDVVFNPQIAAMQAEIDSLNEQLAGLTLAEMAAPKSRRKIKPSGSPGKRARAVAAKRSAIICELGADA